MRLRGFGSVPLILVLAGFLVMLLLPASLLAEKTGPKKRIAVLDFEVKAKNADKKIGTGISEMLIDALVNSDRYIVLERGELDEVMKEQSLGASGNVTEETAAKSGQLLTKPEQVEPPDKDIETSDFMRILCPKCKCQLNIRL